MNHVRYVYSCRHCQREEIETPIQTAPMPNLVISGSLASPSIVAHIVNQKYVEGLPLYRQEKQFHRMGLALSRQTMANWMIYGADRWFTPLYTRMHQLLLKLNILCADETTLQVLVNLGDRLPQNPIYGCTVQESKVLQLFSIIIKKREPEKTRKSS